MTAIEQREGEPTRAETTPAETGPYHGTLATMAIGALGVVYGDIGTSPLYTFKTAIEWAGGKASPAVALPKRMQAVTETGHELVKEAKGLGRGV